MKTLISAFATALLIAGLLITPASAAVTSSEAASEVCGSTYTVQAKDNLSKIASYCGTTLSELLALNPQISNPNIIYTGQVINISGSTVTRTYTSTYYGTGATYSGYWYPYGSGYQYGYARVSLSTTSAEAGDQITVYVTGFPANADIDYRISQVGDDYVAVYDGTIDSEGTDDAIITIPDEADEGEYWIVLVTTTSQADGVSAYSHTIYIDN